MRKPRQQYRQRMSKLVGRKVAIYQREFEKLLGDIGESVSLDDEAKVCMKPMTRTSRPHCRVR